MGCSWMSAIRAEGRVGGAASCWTQLMCRRRSTFFLTSVGLAVVVLPYVSPLSFGSSLAGGYRSSSRLPVDLSGPSTDLR